MTTPVHPTKKLGSRGELKAAVIFADIGWAPPVKLSEDIGTDLVTFARDTASPEDKQDAWDLGAPVFMQVKGSDTEYLRPSHRQSGEPGWWFAESDTYHFDHWLSFGLPYLLVLVDTKNQIGYWAEVSGDAIVSTGKGRKIFVPAKQKVDENNAAALAKIAVGRRRYALEGTAWKGALNDLAPADRLRHALLLPRLVAPHPNKSIHELSSEQAAAMILRNRYHVLAHPSAGGRWPKVEDWKTHNDWGWRFAHALQELVTEGSSSRFQELAVEARHRFERDACLVIQACAQYTNDQAQAALDCLKPSPATKPADRGWLQVQRAALLLELDRPAEAADAATKALIASRALDGDLSVSAIRGAAASLLYSIAGFESGDLEAAITAQDNASNWWRAQDVSWALEKDLKMRFEGWTANDSVQFIDTTVSDDLARVAWNAAFNGAWGTWRHLTAMRAKLALTSTADPHRISAGLGALVFTGEKKATQDAARKMWLDGPIDALDQLANVCAYRSWSKRDEGPTMALLAEAGDLLNAGAADHVVQRIVDLFKVDGSVRVHGQAWTFRWSEADATLRRVLKAANLMSHKVIADLIAADFAECDEGIALAYLRIASALDTVGIGVVRLRKLLNAALDRNDHHAIGLLEIIARDSSAAVAELRKQASSGNKNAVRSLLVAGSTDIEDFLALGRSAAKTVREMVENARGKGGTRVMSGYVNDQLDELTLAALNTNDTKLWKAVTDALEACVIEETQQQRAVRRLASQFQNLPPHVQRKLRKLAPQLRGISFGVSFGGRPNEYSAAVAQLQIAAGTVPDLEVEALLLRQRRSSPIGFVRTLAAWNSERKLPFLATMVVDENPAVRGQAAFSLLEHAHRYPDDRERAFAVIQSAVMQETGGALLDGIAQALNLYPAEELRPLEVELRTHKSAVIRARFSEGE